MRRVVIPELLDSDAGTREEINASLRDLRHINEWFGGVTTLASLLRKVARRAGTRHLSVLDVASGNGDVAGETRLALANEQIQVDVTLLDRAFTHMNGAGHSVVGDALALPFADASFDVVMTTLFIHHLEPAQIATFAREALRVCRVAFVVNDLVRSPIHLALVYAGLPLFRSRVTWHDAPASVRRAYTAEELRDAVAQASPASVEMSRHYLFRLGVIAWK